MSSPPCMLVSGILKCESAAMAAMQAAESKSPSWSRIWMVQTNNQTFEPATRQSDSVERAEDRRIERSRRRERCASASVCLCEPSVQFGGKEHGRNHKGSLARSLLAYLPISKWGAAIGESSVVIVKIPSNLRSGLGAVIEAEIRARALDKRNQWVSTPR